MANNFLALSGSVMLSGSLQMSGGDLQGNLIGTASHATYADNLTATSLVLADLTITNTASIEYLNVVYQSSSVIYSSGSNIFGDAPSDTQTLHGQVEIINDAHIYGALQVDGPISGNITGSLQGNVVGNADTATSASHAATSDLAQMSLSGSYAATSDLAQMALSSSYAATSDLAQAAISASYAANSDLAQASISSSYSANSDFAQLAASAAYADLAELSVSGSHAVESDHALASDTAISASHALLADGLNATSLTLADLIITNTASIEYLNVVYQSSSVIYSSGSNIFGDAPSDTQTLHGQVEVINDAHIYGTLQVDGGISGNITGSLHGNADTAISASFATYANAATSALTASYFLTSSVTSASYALTASYALSVADVVFNREWHVSSGSGDDTTGNGSLSKPFKTLTKALTVAGGTGELIVVHPGTYRESVTINQANITIQGPQNAGGISYVSGSITVATANSNASVRMVGLMANNIIHNNVSRMYVRDVTIQNSIVKSGNATYVEFDNVNCQAAGGISVTGAGTVIFEGNNIALVTVNNASAAVFVKGALSCTGVTVTAGTFVADNSIVYPLASGSAAITSAVGSVVYLYNTNITTTTGLPERISIGGFLGYDDALFNKGLSTLGTSLNLKANFQSLDVNNITATGSLLGNASTATSASFATVANGLNPGSSISAVNITGSGNLQISGKVNFLNLGNYADDTIAAANGVAVGDLYRNGNFVVIRVS